MKKQILVSLFTLCILSIGYTSVSGQARPTFSFQVVPENYEAGDRVTLNIESFSLQLDTQNIVWSIDGKVVLEGKGKKKFTTLAPMSGVEKKVMVVVDNNVPVKKIFILRTKDLSLYVESVDGYVPVWYRGRSRITEESVAKIIVVPASFPAIDGDTESVYSWSKGGFRDQNQSGTNRQGYALKLNPFNNNETISVKVDGFEKEVIITPQRTSLSLYEYSPLIGMRFNAILDSNITLIKEDVTLEAVPWFFSLLERNSSRMSIVWTVNGLPVQNPANKLSLNVRKGSQTKGVAKVGIAVKHKDRTLQTNRLLMDINLR